MSTLFRIHSDLRWLLVMVAILTLARLALGLFGQRPYDKSSRILMLVFGILVDVQVVVGLIYFVWNGARHDFWPRYRFEHMAVMLIALFVAHLPVRWRKAPGAIRTRNELLTVIVVLALIFVGVLVLVGGMNRWEPNF